MKFGAHIILKMYMKILAQLFLYKLSSALNSCQQLMKINLKSWNLAHIIFEVLIKLKFFNK